MPDNKTPKYQYNHYDFGDMLDSAVETGSKIGSSVLGSIADALAQAGDAMSRPLTAQAAGIILPRRRPSAAFWPGAVRWSWGRCSRPTRVV